MHRFQKLVWLLPLLTLIHISTPVSSAQEPQCAAIVAQAWDAVDNLCAGTERQQACYGHASIVFQPQPGFNSVLFEQPGDVVDVVSIQSLRFSAMDLATGQWGVAQMRLQANIPAASIENVTMLVFGDVEIENAVAAPTSAVVRVVVDSRINIRRMPSTQSSIISQLAPGATVTAIARLTDSSWLQIEVPETRDIGWIYAPLVSAPADEVADLNITTGSTPYYGSMQAFYFSSSSQSPICDEMPPDGLLIQTPEGVAEVSLLINEVNIQIGSTAFLTAVPGEAMAIQVVEGRAKVQTDEGQSTAIAGTQITIPLDENLSPAAPPTVAEAYKTDAVSQLPINQLERSIEIADPLDIKDYDVIDVVCANEATGELDEDCVEHWEENLDELIDECFDDSTALLDPACVNDVIGVEDFDEDGVPNPRDDCPARPGPATNSGCPLNDLTDDDVPPATAPDDDCAMIGDCPSDSDADGVPDDLDDCPFERGSAASAGCPQDSDGDGIIDVDDDCPFIPGPMGFGGCPDDMGSDDGTGPDPDPCADPSSAGDPACVRDSDGDGLIDLDDDCPFEPGPVDTGGCPDNEPPPPDGGNSTGNPDRDGDGILDDVDDCPDEAGPLANFGCPIN